MPGVGLSSAEQSTARRATRPKVRHRPCCQQSCSTSPSPDPASDVSPVLDQKNSLKDRAGLGSEDVTACFSDKGLKNLEITPADPRVSYNFKPA